MLPVRKGLVSERIEAYLGVRLVFTPASRPAAVAARVVPGSPAYFIGERCVFRGESDLQTSFRCFKSHDLSNLKAELKGRYKGHARGSQIS